MMTHPNQAQPDTVVAQALKQVVAAHERFAVCIQQAKPSGAGAAAGSADGELSWGQIVAKEFVAAAIADSQRIFQIDSARHAAQLWLYSLCGNIITPSLYAMVMSEVNISLDFTQATLFSQDGTHYWLGAHPHNQAEDAYGTGVSLGTSMRPLIDTISTVVDMKPAPLWAVLADAVVQPVVGCAVAEFEQGKGLELAFEIHDGVASTYEGHLAPVRIDAVRDSEVCQQQLQVTDIEVAEEADALIAHRASCCMVFQSPQAEYCTSCPKRDKQQRVADQIAAVSGW